VPHKRLPADKKIDINKDYFIHALGTQADGGTVYIGHFDIICKVNHI